MEGVGEHNHPDPAPEGIAQDRPGLFRQDEVRRLDPDRLARRGVVHQLGNVEAGMLAASFSAFGIGKKSDFIHRLQALVPVGAAWQLHNSRLRLKLRPSPVERRLGLVDVSLKDGPVHRRDGPAATGREALGRAVGSDEAAVFAYPHRLHLWPVPERHEVYVGLCGGFALNEDVTVNPVTKHRVALFPESAQPEIGVVDVAPAGDQQVAVRNE